MTAVTYPLRDTRPAPGPRVAVRRSSASRRAVYLRRRLAVLVLLAAVIACGWRGVALGSEPLIAPGSPVPSGQQVHVVEPGDTLWSIARSLQPTGDVRPVVDRLADLRGGRPLQVGERIPLP